MENTQAKGKLITLYGINGIGKTTQTERLVGFLEERGLKASRLKYPVYGLEPEGPFIYKYLRDPEFRSRNPRTTEELQKLYADNRERYEPELRRRLSEGEWIVAEDYVGTGVAWGLAWGADLEYLEEINRRLLGPDLAILMHGHRFETAIESNHRNETEGERIRICKNIHLLLAGRYGWKTVDANRSMEEVGEDISNLVREIL
jgi:thymidylate kinase